VAGGKRVRKDAVKEGDNMVSVMKRTQVDGSTDKMSDAEITDEIFTIRGAGE
jgi:cytochrome P450